VWYELKHGERGAGGVAKARAATRQKLELTNHIICKVAVQAAAPAVLVLSCGCFLGEPPAPVPVEESGPGPTCRSGARPAFSPSSLLRPHSETAPKYGQFTQRALFI
jgi:hypothetical protein